LLNAPRFWGRGVIQPPESALNASKSALKRLKRPYEFSMNHALKKEKYRSGARGCSLKYHVRESCAWNYVPRPMKYARSDDNLPYLHSRAVWDRSLILPMQYCAASLSFVVTVIRGPDAQSAIYGRVTHTRAVVTGWWQNFFGCLIADCQGSLRLGQQQFIAAGSGACSLSEVVDF